MSTPSSRLVLVTTARTCPARRADSIARRRCASRAEWCATTTGSGPAGEFWFLPQVVRELFGEGAGIGEDDRRAVAADGPTQAFQQPAVAQAAVRRFAGLDQALDGDLDRRRASRRRCLDDAASARSASQKSNCVVARAARCREADANRIALRRVMPAARAKRPGRRLVSSARGRGPRRR